MQIDITHIEDESRYELVVDGHLASFAEYVRSDSMIRFTRTVTVPAMRDQGLAATVIRQALDDARAAGLTVIPQCWFVAEFIDENPEYATLLPAPSHPSRGSTDSVVHNPARAEEAQ